MLELSIRKSLPGVRLDVTLRVGAETLVLFGPSGAGKSLTLKLLAGVATPDSGYVRLDGNTLYEGASGTNVPPQRRRIGLVPQHSALFPHMTALENVAFPLRAGRGWRRDAARARAAELLRSFALEDRLAARPAQLSGGQQQRVALARALAGEPELLLLDEPFAALDAPIRLELRDELRAIRRRLGIPMIFVTHDLEEAATLADRLAVLVDGHVRQSDTTRAVLDQPADCDVAQLVQARNIIPGTVERGADGLTARTPIGPLRLDARRTPPVGAVAVVVRPEAIQLDPADAEHDDNLLRGIVVDLVDHGTRIVAHVLVGEGRLEVSVPPVVAGARSLGPGSAVRLVIAPASVHVVPAT